MGCSFWGTLMSTFVLLPCCTCTWTSIILHESSESSFYPKPSTTVCSCKRPSPLGCLAMRAGGGLSDLLWLFSLSLLGLHCGHLHSRGGGRRRRGGKWRWEGTVSNFLLFGSWDSIHSGARWTYEHPTPAVPCVRQEPGKDSADSVLTRAALHWDYDV